MPEILSTACPMDCPDTCSLDVEITEGRISAIRGSNLNPITSGFICSKVRNFTKRVYSAERILYPMKRTGIKGTNSFERISWNDAVDLICSKLRNVSGEFGSESILPFYYGGSNGMLGQETADRAFFAKLGASRLALTVCAAPSSAAAMGMYGKMPGVAFEDYVHSKLILIWGGNPKASNIHLVPFLKKAKANGARIAIVDPRLNFSQREYDLHLPVFPGTDLAIALAMIRYWNDHGLLNWNFLNQHAIGVDVLLNAATDYPLERAAALSGVPAADIARLAEMYAESSPAVIRMGWGPERNRNGGQATAAVLAMPALLGKFGVRGGGYTLSNSTAAKVVTNKMVEAAPWNTRELNMNLLGRILLEENNPPVKALFVYNCNPAATMPNQKAVLSGLEREDLFTVVFDQILTDTANYADVLLPAVTFLEQHEVKKSYGSYSLQYIEPVIDPCGEAKPNEQVFALLGRGMGWSDTAFHETTDDYLRRASRAVRGLGYEVNLEELQKKKILMFDFPGTTPIQFETAFPWTSNGKINLAPSTLGENAYRYLDDQDINSYPLALISPATSKTISSTMGEYNLPELYVTMNPRDAEHRKLHEGNVVRVFNQYGEVHCRARIRKDIRTGVAIIPKGAWRKASLNGYTANALAPDTLGTAGGACFNDARVEIMAISATAPADKNG